MGISFSSGQNTASIAMNKKRTAFASGIDIRLLGILFVLSGVIDFFWILSYPNYALKVFGTTFTGWTGEMVKYQHPVIHLAIGYGFWKTKKWALYTYLVYLTLACMSEITTQMVQGYHPTRTTMIIISIIFGLYIVWRRHIFQFAPST